MCICKLLSYESQTSNWKTVYQTDEARIDYMNENTYCAKNIIQEVGESVWFWYFQFDCLLKKSFSNPIQEGSMSLPPMTDFPCLFQLRAGAIWGQRLRLEPTCQPHTTFNNICARPQKIFVAPPENICWIFVGKHFLRRMHPALEDFVEFFGFFWEKIIFR